ncbi:MAG: serine hydrolase domain-containing protein [Bacteroidota bacterium]
MLSILRPIFILSLFILSACHSGNDETSQREQLDNFLLQQLREHNVPGLSFALIEDNQLAYHQVYGWQNLADSLPVEKHTLFEAASVSKAVFAYFTLKMVDRGLLQLDTPLHDYFPHPDLSDDERARGITARMVLAHTSGLPNWRFFSEDGTLALQFAPGTQFSYSGEGYEYLASVLAHLLGTDYRGLEAAIAREVFQPLGMVRSTFSLDERVRQDKATGYEDGAVSEGLPAEMIAPYFGAAFSLHTEANDFARFLLALSKREGLATETFSEMYRPQVTLPADESLRTEDGFEAWGLGIIRGNTPRGVKLVHGGMNPSFQAYFMFLEEKGFGFTFFGNSNTALELVPALEQFLLAGE